jgi:hypothetical protein
MALGNSPRTTFPFFDRSSSGEGSGMASINRAV